MADSARPVLYVNVYIKDASQAVKSQVEEKISQKRLPGPLKERLAKRAAKVAADLITASKIVEKMAPKMAEEMPIKMKPKGLTVHVGEVFREGPFFVLQLQVVHVDTIVMAEAVRLQEEEDGETMTVQCLKQFFGTIGSRNQDALETNYLPRIIQSKMGDSMGDMLSSELAEKGLEAEAEVLPEALQARFFFPFLQQIRESEAKSKKGPLANLRKK
uniref:Uncharacterized protein n=1 Tax=Cyclophora tenuis TaxID=216820 RepID=A0A7S1GJX8_CYCTE|mmetsp:Transcript_17755/g.30162  ORF Transcript_17755/g.30162 Transcript_17755/m.30162 type:complete len:216 (+) Transcript_17755:170-817(+)